MHGIAASDRLFLALPVVIFPRGVAQLNHVKTAVSEEIQGDVQRRSPPAVDDADEPAGPLRRAKAAHLPISLPGRTSVSSQVAGIAFNTSSAEFFK